MQFSLFTARRFVDEGEFIKALANYLVVLKSVDIAVRHRYHNEFLQCVRHISGSYVVSHDLVRPILELFSDSCELGLLVAQKVGEYGSLPLATAIFEKVGKLSTLTAEQEAVVRICMSNIKTHSFDSWHIAMLNDSYRNSRFLEAISRCISENDIVLEIGSGTGLLSVLANRFCPRVIAVEENEAVFDVSKSVVSSNIPMEKHEQLKLLNINSAELSLTEQEKATVVVSEIMDCSAFGEGMLQTFRDAHNRLVTTNARFIPSKVCLYLTLIESPSMYKLHAFERYRSKYVNLGYNEPEEPYWCAHLSDFPDFRRLSLPTPLLGVNLQSKEDIEKYLKGVAEQFTASILQSGTVHCVAVHFRAELCDGIFVDSSAPECSCWEYGIFPLADPLIVNQGDTVPLTWSLKGSRLDIHYEEGLGIFETSPNCRLLPMSVDNIALCNDLRLNEEVIAALPPGANMIALTRPMSFTIPLLRSGKYVVQETEDDESAGFLKILRRRDSTEAEGQGQDPAMDLIVWWPINADGSLNDEEIMTNMPNSLRRFRDARTGLMGEQPLAMPKCFPAVLSCRAQLISSNRLASLCRPDPSAHCGVDLDTDLRKWSLFEYRDIDLAVFEHVVCSEEFSLYDYEFQSNLTRMLESKEDDLPEYHLFTKQIQTTATREARIDGVIYWWSAGSYSTRTAARCSAFIFNQPVSAVVGQQIPLRFDIYKGQMLVTLA